VYIYIYGKITLYPLDISTVWQFVSNIQKLIDNPSMCQPGPSVHLVRLFEWKGSYVQRT
jgi:hypothetical protein